jgi:hypothetical protein
MIENGLINNIRQNKKLPYKFLKVKAKPEIKRKITK